jgi:hypothetical protein
VAFVAIVVGDIVRVVVCRDFDADVLADDDVDGDDDGRVERDTITVGVVGALADDDANNDNERLNELEADDESATVFVLVVVVITSSMCGCGGAPFFTCVSAL